MDRFTINSSEMKNDEYDQISRMLGHGDTIHLFGDERCYEPVLENNWPPIVNSSIVEIPNTDIQPTKRFFTKEQRFSDHESKSDNCTPPVLLTKLCCASEMCVGKCTRNNVHTNNTLNGVTKQLFYKRLCLFSIVIAFMFGVLLGILIPFVYLTKDITTIDSNYSSSRYQSLILINKPVNSTLINNNSQLSNAPEVNRVFHPIENKFDYIKSKMEFPTIHDPKYKNKIENMKSKHSVKLNKPKNFHSVSFVEDENTEDIQNVSNQDGATTKDTLIKYLDLGASNTTNNFFVDFGKKILETNLEEQPLKTINNEKDNDTILHSNIFWGRKIEKSLPSGFGVESNDNWMKYVKTSSAIKMESGCGRMQNRLVTFLDGTQACVRYRQNTDQIQGELFSFYLAQLLKLPNLAPSLVSVVNLTDPLWHNVASDIGSAQWNSNRPVVMTKYIPNLEAAHIPGVFKPSERHLNKFDVLNIVKKGSDKADDKSKDKSNVLLKKITEGLFVDKDIQNDLVNNGIETNNNVVETIVDSLIENDKQESEHLKANIGNALLDKFVELAQWSDLIIFDYLTANLDRIVNNLYNFQWNVNIMDAPAHNLARKVDSNLLLFLDNESGLLHGYRLLHKYEMYHSLLLDSLCIFRKSTAEIINKLHSNGNVGELLNKMFKDANDANVLDILPPLPEKSIKILNERIARVAGKIRMCDDQFGR